MPREDRNGLQWRARKDGTQVAYWVAAARQVKQGYSLKTQRLWAGAAPSETEAKWIADECGRLQAEMLEWGQKGDGPPEFTGTIKSLSTVYQTDQDSPFHDLRFATRKTYVGDLRLIERTVGDRTLARLNGNDFRRWYGKWREPKEVGGSERTRRAHGAIVMLRILLNWGATTGLADCARLADILSRMLFAAPEARKDELTWDQAEAIVNRALEKGAASIALAQALQADCVLRQKDVIGEWVPVEEPGLSDQLFSTKKWLRGLRWESINDDLILMHGTSKRGRRVAHDLKACPLVMRALARVERRASGPVIICEKSGRPYFQRAFYGAWRAIANEVGLPSSVWNMDSRAGGITEGSDSGAEIEHLRHAAGHSNVTTTGRYNRPSPEKSRKVAELRQAFRSRKNGVET